MACAGAIVIVLAAVAVSGCNGGSGNSVNQTNTTSTNTQTGRGNGPSPLGPSALQKTSRLKKGLGEGYRDGLNDGKAAWSDLDGSWTWLWLMSPQYRSEYHRGFADGRNIAKIQKSVQRRKM